jgi:scyllo-inositol 2-dehydrogenase (NADP+)
VVRVAIIGLGKMGLSHHALVNAHPEVSLAGVCDAASYVLDVLGKYTKVRCYADYMKLLEAEAPEAVIIATPTRLHPQMVRAALERGVHVFCEKPFCLDVAEGLRLAELAESRNLITQVGYHYRFVAAFQEMKRLIECGVLGRIHHLRAEAYGPVVLRPRGFTWRTARSEGGGCLYDYACHAVDLLNYLAGPPLAVAGTVLNRVFSEDVEDEVYSELFYSDGSTAHVAANWSDESCRKMSSKVTAWGTNGSVVADRQEVRIYLRKRVECAPELEPGWNVRYTTELSGPVWFYLRGEEYSAQIDHFIQRIRSGHTTSASTFRAAVETDRVLGMMLEDARHNRTGVRDVPRPHAKPVNSGRLRAALDKLVRAGRHEARRGD